MFDMLGGFGIVLGLLLLSGLIGFLIFGRRASMARWSRRQNAPRDWLFVNAYGPQQAQAGERLTFHEARSFLKEHIGCSFVRADNENAIIFFDGRKLGG